MSIPGLSEAEIERVAWMMEKCGAVVQACGKILRHGWDSTHPDGGPTNRALLETEVGDVRAALSLLFARGDLSPAGVRGHMQRKLQTVGRYLHYNTVGGNDEQD